MVIILKVFLRPSVKSWAGVFFFCGMVAAVVFFFCGDAGFFCNTKGFVTADCFMVVWEGFNVCCTCNRQDLI